MVKSIELPVTRDRGVITSCRMTLRANGASAWCDGCHTGRFGLCSPRLADGTFSGHHALTPQRDPLSLPNAVHSSEFHWSVANPLKPCDRMFEEDKMARRRVIEVAPRGEQWVVRDRKTGNEVSFDLKADAVNRGRRTAKQVPGPSQLVIKKQNGTIQTEHTYGNDPYPPPG